VGAGISAAGGISLTGGLTAYGAANFYGDVYLATGANHPGIVDYEFAANTGVTYPSASTPAYTVGDKWSNGSIEYTWNGFAWIENTDNIVSSSPIAFDSIVPSQSITPSKLSLGGPDWSSGRLVVPMEMDTRGLFIRNAGDLYFEARTSGFNAAPEYTIQGGISIAGSSPFDKLDIFAGSTINPSNGANTGIRLTGISGSQSSKVNIVGNLYVVPPYEVGYGVDGTGNVWINGNLQCTGNSLLVGNVSIGGNVTTSGNIIASGSAHNLNGYPILQNGVGEMAFIIANPQSYSETVCGIFPLVTSSTTSTAAPNGGKAANNASMNLGSGGTIVYTSFGGTTTWSKNTSTPFQLRPSQGSWTLLVTPTGVNFYTIVAIRIA
jgi:hypothetical protein